MAAEQAEEAHVPHPQQHEDPMAETRQQFLQGLATMATVGEAGARWAAVGIQNKAADRERQAHRDEAAAAARREADRLAAKVRADRERMAAALDGDWLVNKATFAEAAAVWRTATIHAGTDPVARRAAEFAEQRLRQFRPDLMAAYERHRHAGSAIPEAMRAASREVWENDARAGHRQHGARAHGGTPDRARITPDGPAGLPPSGRGQVDDFDAAVRKEAMTLAEHVRPEAPRRATAPVAGRRQTPGRRTRAAPSRPRGRDEPGHQDRRCRRTARRRDPPRAESRGGGPGP
ncbi:hypothetical protein ACH495_18790 [Micromonospora sp. NPDC018662]|uniref:hypothetical protein n=1 Tax=Micromonospora sp. NPDC018662 TaxID=3364238 RepID=UPI0037A5E106